MASNSFQVDVQSQNCLEKVKLASKVKHGVIAQVYYRPQNLLSVVENNSNGIQIEQNGQNVQNQEDDSESSSAEEGECSSSSSYEALVPLCSPQSRPDSDGERNAYGVEKMSVGSTLKRLRDDCANNVILELSSPLKTCKAQNTHINQPVESEYTPDNDSVNWSRSSDAAKLCDYLCLPRGHRLISTGDSDYDVTDSQGSNISTTPISSQEYIKPNLPVVADTSVNRSIIFPDSAYVAIDCEMVGIGPRGCRDALARCSIVSFTGEILYDNYILPNDEIVDYRTRYSGITPKLMLTAISLDKALSDISSKLNGKLVIGHGVISDFRVLEIPPPIFSCDTQRLPSLRHLVSEVLNLIPEGVVRPKGLSRLKTMASLLLNRHIQKGRLGHCSVEDATATMDLFKLVRHQWEAAVSKELSFPVLYKAFLDSDDSKYLEDKYWSLSNKM